MVVYAISHMQVRDRETFDSYVGRLRKVLPRFSGELLVADDCPSIVQGSWVEGATLVVSFPDKREFNAWKNSPENLGFAKSQIVISDAKTLLAREYETPTIKPDSKKKTRFYFFADEVLTFAFFGALSALLVLSLLLGTGGDGLSFSEALRERDVTVAVLLTAVAMSVAHFVDLRRYRR